MSITPYKLTRRNVVKNIISLFSGSAVAQGMTALTLLFTARQLGAAGYGQYAASLAFAILTAIVFSLGLDIWLLREGGHQPKQLAELIGSVLIVKFVFGVVWFTLISAFAPYLNQDICPAMVLRWSALLVWSDNLLATALTAFKATLRNHIPSVANALSNMVWFLATMALIRFGFQKPGTYIQARAVISVTTLIIAIVLVWRLIGLRWTFSRAKYIVESSLPYAISEFLAGVSMRGDVVIIGFILNEQAVGIYSPAIGLVNMLFILPMAVYTVMVPVLSNLYKRDLRQARNTSRNTIIMLLSAGVGLSLVFAASAPLIGALLGESYQASIGIMRIVSLVLFYKCGSFAMAAIIVATGQQARRAAVQAVAVAFNVIINLVVISRFGLNGAAIVYVLTEIITLGGYTWIVWRRESERKWIPDA